MYVDSAWSWCAEGLCLEGWEGLSGLGVGCCCFFFGGGARLVRSVGRGARSWIRFPRRVVRGSGGLG